MDSYFHTIERTNHKINEIVVKD